MLVLLTRPRGQAEATARRLAAIGHEALVAPLTTIAISDAPPPEGPFDAVLLTSANALPALSRVRDRFVGAPILAVGTRTAEAARSAGFDGVADAGGDARALVDLVTALLPGGGRLLHATGRDRKAEPARSLAARGYEVSTWECYEARAVLKLPPEAAEALGAGRVDAVLHYSRRSAASFRDLCGQAGLAERAAAPLHFCLSADVAEGLGGAGFRRRIAAWPDEAALLRLLSDAAAEAGSRLPQSGC